MVANDLGTPSSIGTHICIWDVCHYTGLTKKRWMIVCGSTIWSLWLARESMFNGKRWDSVEIFNLIHTRSLFWTKACDGMGSVAEYGWWSEPGNLNIAHAPLHTSVNITWQPPQLGEFNSMLTAGLEENLSLQAVGVFFETQRDM